VCLRVWVGSCNKWALSRVAIVYLRDYSRMKTFKSLIRSVSPFMGTKDKKDKGNRQQPASEHTSDAGDPHDDHSVNRFDDYAWDLTDVNFSSAVTKFYVKFNPEKVHKVELIVQKFKGDEIELLRELCKRYNLEKSDMQTFLDSSPKVPKRNTGAPHLTQQPQKHDHSDHHFQRHNHSSGNNRYLRSHGPNESPPGKQKLAFFDALANNRPKHRFAIPTPPVNIDINASRDLPQDSELDETDVEIERPQHVASDDHEEFIPDSAHERRLSCSDLSLGEEKEQDRLDGKRVLESSRDPVVENLPPVNAFDREQRNNSFFNSIPIVPETDDGIESIFGTQGGALLSKSQQENPGLKMGRSSSTLSQAAESSFVPNIGQKGPSEQSLSSINLTAPAADQRNRIPVPTVGEAKRPDVNYERTRSINRVDTMSDVDTGLASERGRIALETKASGTNWERSRSFNRTDSFAQAAIDSGNASDPRNKVSVAASEVKSTGLNWSRSMSINPIDGARQAAAPKHSDISANMTSNQLKGLDVMAIDRMNISSSHAGSLAPAAFTASDSNNELDAVRLQLQETQELLSRATVERSEILSLLSIVSATPVDVKGVINSYLDKYGEQ
jgi:hypothetical protein